MDKTVAQLTADIKRLTKAHEVMVKDAAGKSAKAAADIKALREANAEMTKSLEDMKIAAKKQREEKAEVQVKGMKAKIDAEPHHWVQVFNQGLDDGVDFNFTYEGIPFKLYSGKAVYLPESVIKHLKSSGFPITTEEQGEAGQPVIVAGRHHNFNVVNCEAPKVPAKIAV